MEDGCRQMPTTSQDALNDKISAQFGRTALSWGLAAVALLSFAATAYGYLSDLNTRVALNTDFRTKHDALVERFRIDGGGRLDRQESACRDVNVRLANAERDIVRCNAIAEQVTEVKGMLRETEAYYRHNIVPLLEQSNMLQQHRNQVDGAHRAGRGAD